MSPEDIDRIARSGLFDAAYYESCYREEIAPGDTPLDHFIARGDAEGFKPVPTFDPIVYRLLNPGVAAGRSLIHYLEHHASQPADLTVERALPSVRETKPFNPNAGLKFDLDAERDENASHARKFSDAVVTDVPTASGTFKLAAPAPDTLLRRLTLDRPFAFARLPHGIWDSLFMRKHYRERIAGAIARRDIAAAQIDTLASRFCDEIYPRRGVFAEHFLDEFLMDIAALPDDDRFLNAVAFKGYPTADERLFARSKTLAPMAARLDFFGKHLDPARPLYDAMVWKRWLISGALSVLPELVRDRPVILLGADRLHSLGVRWKLPHFLHVKIPPALSQTLRFGILDRCRAAVDEAVEIARARNTKRPVFILQGGSFAYWLIYRLFKINPDIFYIDLGQALHAWFWDIPDVELAPWGERYGRTIVENCNLGPYYEELGAHLPEGLTGG